MDGGHHGSGCQHSSDDEQCDGGEEDGGCRPQGRAGDGVQELVGARSCERGYQAQPCRRGSGSARGMQQAEAVEFGADGGATDQGCPHDPGAGGGDEDQVGVEPGSDVVLDSAGYEEDHADDAGRDSESQKETPKGDLAVQSATYPKLRGGASKAMFRLGFTLCNSYSWVITCSA
jgi:hypothetical protein